MTTDLFSVAGKTVVITGGTRGIGYMTAEGFLKAGAKVYVTSRKADAVEAATASLSQFGEVVGLPCDVSDPERSAELVEQIGSRESAVHVLVNNAGATWGAGFDEFPASAWDKVMGLNVKAPFILTQQLRPLLEAGSTEGDPSRVINIGSIDGIAVPGYDNFSYGASKAAVHHLTKHMASELSPSILVNAIAPGPFPTKMMAASLAEQGDEIVGANPVGRIGTPEDAAGLAIFLSSRASTYITGATIPLDGGLSTTMKVM
ncbi:SDR family oxidoreductase [Aeromicrobium choanae]|uniref:NAD(P)-dependent dehydrogenase, short-chain alcohol dehydrogenase family n=1 Tax=Aeromicrobium choanae TaxID=1736691 RepID=A0A1T4YRZ4_9ACTN|nr:SDR family oxidoreductase [Aeromicrobium choanae]SKB04500.1 NAD(P)-dependent dehydrogenase, short-chain alcohol dehydrogenase family [Aeromicrobium choanae]